MTGHVALDGFVDDRFEKVRDVFADNFAERGEVGAAVAVYVEGEPVVDLWGGATVRGGAPVGPWERDSLVCMFSVNKGVSSICGHRLADEGRLDYDKPVARYWPEFAQAGKQDITVRQLMGGLAALVYPDEVPDGRLFDWDAMVDGLARQAPAWPVGTRGAEHSSTHGHLVGELVRRTTGRMPDEYFRAEIAEPLGIDYWFTVPPAERHRVSEVLPHSGSIVAEVAEGGRMDKVARAWRVAPHLDIVGLVNDPEYGHRLMPSAWGRGNARAIARLFAALSVGGTLDGYTMMSPETVREATTLHWVGSQFPGLDWEARYAMGLFLNCPPSLPLGPDMRSYGQAGAGGNLGFADPGRRLAFGYCTNSMPAGGDLLGDRCTTLIDAVFASI